MSKKLTELTELAVAPDAADLLYIVDTSEPSSSASKCITVQNALASCVKEGDARLSDARTPTEHKSTHAAGGLDAISPSDIGAAALNDYTQVIFCAEIEAASSIASALIVGTEVNATSLVGDSLVIGWAAGTPVNVVPDATNQLAVRNGTAAQSLAVYRTSSNSNANYERVRLVSDGTRFFLRPENAGAGTLRPLIVRMAPQTVSALPTASSAGTGARAVVSDASSPTFGATVTGGGSTMIPVYSDGTDWRVG